MRHLAVAAITLMSVTTVANVAEVHGIFTGFIVPYVECCQVNSALSYDSKNDFGLGVGNLPIGQKVTGSFSYNSSLYSVYSAPNYATRPNDYYYWYTAADPTDFTGSITINGHTKNIENGTGGGAAISINQTPTLSQFNIGSGGTEEFRMALAASNYMLVASNLNDVGTVGFSIDTSKQELITNGSSVTFLDGTVVGFQVSSIQVSAVPLPGALPLFGAALVGLGGLARRRLRKAALTPNDLSGDV